MDIVTAISGASGALYAQRFIQGSLDKLSRMRTALPNNVALEEIGRASCRERVCQYV